MSKITYTDKEYIYENASIPAINKITDDDMNEIKSVVNENDTRLTTTEGEIDNLQTGWIPANETWTYASPSTITVPSGAVNRYSKGDKIKLQQTTIKYFYIIGVADTVLTITGGSDYTLTNATITEAYFSHSVTPIGFPQWFNWVPDYSGVTIGNGRSEGKFCLIGKTVAYHILLTLGSTSSVNGVISMGFPIPVSSSYSGTDLLGGGMALIGSTGYGMVSSAAGAIYNTYVSGTNLAYRGTSATIPETWLNGSTIQSSATYEIN